MKDLLLDNKDQLFSLVLLEANKQVDKWGIQNRSPFEWLAFLHEESGELAQAISEWYFRSDDTTHIVKEAIQTATLALKIAEMFLMMEVVDDPTPAVGAPTPGAGNEL